MSDTRLGDVTTVIRLVLRLIWIHDFEGIAKVLKKTDPVQVSSVVVVALLRTTFQFRSRIGPEWQALRDRANQHMTAGSGEAVAYVLQGLFKEEPNELERESHE